MTAVSTITIKKIEFTYSAPYSEGHVLSAEEAIALNRARGETLRGGFAPYVTATLEDNEFDLTTPEEKASIIAQLREKFAARDANFVFGSRTTGDELTIETERLAREIIRAHLEQKNPNAVLPKGKELTAIVRGFLSKNPEKAEKLRAQAAERLALAASMDSTSIDDLVF